MSKKTYCIRFLLVSIILITIITIIGTMGACSNPYEPTKQDAENAKLYLQEKYSVIFEPEIDTDDNTYVGTRVPDNNYVCLNFYYSNDDIQYAKDMNAQRRFRSFKVQYNNGEWMDDRETNLYAAALSKEINDATLPQCIMSIEIEPNNMGVSKKFSNIDDYKVYLKVDKNRVGNNIIITYKYGDNAEWFTDQYITNILVVLNQLFCLDNNNDRVMIRQFSDKTENTETHEVYISRSTSGVLTIDRED